MVGFSLLYVIIVYCIKNLLSVATGHGYVPLNPNFTTTFLPTDYKNGFSLRSVSDSGFNDYVRVQEHLNSLPDGHQLTFDDYL